MSEGEGLIQKRPLPRPVSGFVRHVTAQGLKIYQDWGTGATVSVTGRMWAQTPKLELTRLHRAENIWTVYIQHDTVLAGLYCIWIDTDDLENWM